MNIEIIRDTFIAGAYKGVGDTATVADSLGEYLISLGRAVQTGATSVTLAESDLLKTGLWIALSPYTARCEIRRVTSEDGFTAGVAALSNSHVQNEDFELFDEPVFPASLYSADLQSETDVALRVQAAIDDLALIGGGTLVIPPGSYTALTTVIVAEGVTLALSQKTTYTMAADQDIIRIDDGGFLDGHFGKLVATPQSGSYTKAAVYLNGEDQIHFQVGKTTGFRNIYISLPTGEGIGLRLFAEGVNNFGYITGARFDNFTIQNGEYGILFDGGTFAPSGYFMNTNVFSRFTLVNNVYPLWFESGVIANGNLFSDFLIQDGDDTTQPIQIAGYQNQLHNFHVWDFTGAVELGLTSDSRHNAIAGAIEPTRVRDYGAGNIVQWTIRDTRFGKVSTYTQTPRVIHNYGPHSDVLANANHEYTVSQTAGSSPTAGALDNMFTNNPEGFCQWASPTLPITVEITMPASERFFEGIGINFEESNVPEDVTVELWDGSSWLVVVDGDVYIEDSLYIAAPAFANGDSVRLANITKIRFTASTLRSGSSNLLIRTIFAHFSTSYGTLWAPRAGALFVTPPRLPTYTVATLPSGTAGEAAFASDGRKNGEGASSGTGVMVFFDGSNWIATDTGAAVAA